MCRVCSPSSSRLGWPGSAIPRRLMSQEFALLLFRDRDKDSWQSFTLLRGREPSHSKAIAVSVCERTTILLQIGASSALVSIGLEGTHVRHSETVLAESV